GPEQRGGERLQPAQPGRVRLLHLGGGRDAGHRGEARFLARPDHLEVQARADGEGGTSVGGGAGPLRIEDRAGADALAALASGGDDGLQRREVLGALQRDLDGVDAEVPGGRGELEAALGAHAAQDRHEGRVLESVVEPGGAVHSLRAHQVRSPSRSPGVGRSFVLDRARAAFAWPRIRRSSAPSPRSRPSNQPAANASPAPTGSTPSKRGVGTAVRTVPSNSTASISASFTTRCGTSGKSSRIASGVAVPQSTSASSRPTRRTSACSAAARISRAASSVESQRAGRWFTSTLTSAPASRAAAIAAWTRARQLSESASVIPVRCTIRALARSRRSRVSGPMREAAEPAR